MASLWCANASHPSCLIINRHHVQSEADFYYTLSGSIWIYVSSSSSSIIFPFNGSGRAKQSSKNLRQLQVHDCAPLLSVRSPSRGIATDAAISAENLYAFGVKHVTKGLGRITEGIMTKGEGSYVVYDDGRRMLDFTCGIGVTSLGKFVFPRRCPHFHT